MDGPVFSEGALTQSARGEEAREKEQKMANFANLKSAMIDKSTVSNYIEKSLNEGMQPLPILSKINDVRQSLILIRYKMNEANAKSFASAMMQLVPTKLRQLCLIENNLTDDTISTIFQNLSKNQIGGLQTITLIKNTFGDQAIYNLSHKYLESDAA